MKLTTKTIKAFKHLKLISIKHITHILVHKSRMLAKFYMPRLWNDIKIARQKIHFV